jgi:hypothetical protein
MTLDCSFFGTTILLEVVTIYADFYRNAIYEIQHGASNSIFPSVDFANMADENKSRTVSRSATYSYFPHGKITMQMVEAITMQMAEALGVSLTWQYPMFKSKEVMC